MCSIRNRDLYRDIEDNERPRAAESETTREEYGWEYRCVSVTVSILQFTAATTPVVAGCFSWPPVAADVPARLLIPRSLVRSQPGPLWKALLTRGFLVHRLSLLPAGATDGAAALADHPFGGCVCRRVGRRRRCASGSVGVGDREDLLLRVLVYEFRVVFPHMLLRLVDQLVIRLGLDDFTTGAMDSLHERLLRFGGLF